MADFGRVHAFAIASRNGCVVYERFYDRLSEVQKAELRNALGQCSRDVAKMQNAQSLRTTTIKAMVGRGATIVYQPQGPLVFYCVGSGEYDELTMLSTIAAVLLGIRAAVKTDRTLTEQLLLSKYDKVCVVVDEVIHEGIMDTMHTNEVMAALKMAA